MRNRLLLFALLIPNLAWSQTWSGFDSANPAFPCQDGWMGCIQDGKPLQAEIQTDTTGMPVTADLRIGWFDLAPTSNFTPFSGLSTYAEGPPKRITEDEPEPVVAANTDPPDGTEPPDPENPGTQDDPATDGSAAVDFMDPEAERARMDAEQKRLEEAEKRRAQQRASEEAERARREEERRNREADERARAAARAMQLVQKASNDADRSRLKAEADAAEADRKRAADAAAEAANMRKERERQEAEKKRQADQAAADSRKAEEERKRKEAEEARKAEIERAAETKRREAAAAEAKKAADAARIEAERVEKARVAEAEKKAKEAADKAAAAKNEQDRARLEAEQKRLAEEQRKAAEEAKRKSEEAAAKAAADAQKKADDAERKRQADRAAAQEAERQKLQEEQAKKLAEEKGAEEKEGDSAQAGDCSDLIQLETKAVLGKLDSGTLQCLETRLGASTRQTEKGKISRLLMGNAFATDKSEWERLMKRHLEQIDQSDPDLCYKYALQLVKKGAGSSFAVIKWADVALENRAVWTGSTYQQRVYSLYKVRTVAANNIWRNYENKHAASPTDETNEKVKDARNRTKVYAREWYEYAKAADKDTTEALNTCQSAAGTKKYCEAG